MRTSHKILSSLAVSISTLVLSALLSQFTMAADYPAPGDFQQGAKTWAENCSRCHNMRGPEELRDDQWITTVFHMRIRAGLTGQEARDVITFLQGSNSKPVMQSTGYSSRDVGVESNLSGQEIYNMTCAACHGATGKGSLPGMPDFTSATGPLSKQDETLIRHITEGFKSPGSSMAMPPNGGNPSLTRADIRSVLKYLRGEFGR